MTSVSDQSPDTAHLCTLCILPCEEDNTLNRAKCATSVHANCLIKKGREKATKKVQGASPTWLHEVLFATGICYFCPTCLPALQFTSVQHVFLHYSLTTWLLIIGLIRQLILRIKLHELKIKLTCFFRF